MKKFIETLKEANFQDHILSDHDLSVIFGGTAASRYGLVNKAIKRGDLLRIRRGIYVLGKQHRRTALSAYTLANRIMGLSYVSLESALQFHGWIPERVSVITNIISGRHPKQFDTPLGVFEFFCLNTREYEFFTLVKRIAMNDQQVALIAAPLRALMDYVYVRDIEWSGIDFLTEGLRIEQENLMRLTQEDFFKLKRVYRSKRVLNFLVELDKWIIKNES